MCKRNKRRKPATRNGSDARPRSCLVYFVLCLSPAGGMGKSSNSGGRQTRLVQFGIVQYKKRKQDADVKVCLFFVVTNVYFNESHETLHERNAREERRDERWKTKGGSLNS